MDPDPGPGVHCYDPNNGHNGCNGMYFSLAPLYMTWLTSGTTSCILKLLVKTVDSCRTNRQGRSSRHFGKCGYRYGAGSEELEFEQHGGSVV